MDPKQILEQCSNVLVGHGEPVSLKATLGQLAESLDGSEDLDVYGSGTFINTFEQELAERFGKESAVFMPSGTMAQQIALRISCEASGNFTVAMHPTAHPETAEQFGYQYLHGIKRLQFGVPEFIGHRPLTADDLDALGKKPGAILLELPYRPLGGLLPEWDNISAISDWARSQGVPIHLDGARIWSCADAYRKPYSEIADLFDSVYVSFYKDIGALSGSALLGSAELIGEARIWQHRHGGNLVTQAPAVVSARQRLDKVLPQLAGWNARAREVAAAFSAHERIRINPQPPQVNFFQVYMEGDPEDVLTRHHELAMETGTFLFWRMMAVETPGFCRTEIHCWESAMSFDTDPVNDFLVRLLET